MARNTAKADEPVKAFPAIDILERRLRTGDAGRTAIVKLQLTHQPEPMALYECNTELQDGGRYYEMQQLGWVPVEPAEIDGGLPQGPWREDQNRVVTGTGERLIVLMKMPARYREAIRRAKDDRLDRRMRSRTALMSSTREDAERVAKASDKATAERLERGAEAFDGRNKIAHLEIDQLDVSVSGQ